MTIVFDLDETLISTSYRQYKVLCDIFPEINFPGFKDYESKRIRESSSNYQWVRNYIKNIDKEQYIELYTKCIEKYEYLRYDTLKVDLNLLKDLVTNNQHNLILVSLRNSKANGFAQLNDFELIEYFSEIHFVKHNSTKNPKVDLIKSLKNNYNIVLYLGDSLIDKEAARLNNIPFIPVSSSIHNTFDKANDINYCIKEIINE